MMILKKGPGIPLIFLHGFLGAPQDWEPVISHLPSCLCIALELPGHGASPFTSDFAIPYEKFHLIGYSMGGRLAMQYARKFPRKIASLAIASAHPGLLKSCEKQARLEQDRRWAKKLLTLPIDQFLSQWYDQPIFHFFKPDFSMRRNHDPKQLAQTLLHYSLGRQSFYQPEGALYLVGEKDQKYRALYPKAVQIERAAHMVHLENPKRVAQAIQQKVFL
jgi:2-succinyl-6-hydroxy-2,4-cyclohexadiene-1-carboxylate synthase